MKATNEIMETPIYGLREAAHYLRVPSNTLRYWTQGSGSIPPLIHLSEQARLSFANLLEAHMLSSMRKIYNVRVPRVRKALANLAKYVEHKHPLIEEAFETDRRDLFIERLGKKVNLYKDEQILIPGIMEAYLERIERDPRGLFTLYPFVVAQPKRNEPKMILISPAVGFGKPVIAGTDISTAVVASRFNARESIEDLATEYGVTPKKIEEAIRWEQRTAALAA
jgi:uncharacterized protein (DUF433 family)